MTAEQWDYRVACVDCDAVIDTSEQPVFEIQGDVCLCLKCAARRGAEYDPTSQVWRAALSDARGLA